MVKIRSVLLAAVLPIILAVMGPAAAAPVILDERVSHADLAGHMEVLRDESGALAIDDMQRPEVARRFQALSGDLAAGFDRSAYWLRFQVVRAPAAERRWYLDVRMPYLDHVTLFVPESGGHAGAVSTGDRTPFSTRPVPHRTFVFETPIGADSPQTFYLRVQTTSNVSVSAKLWSKGEFGKEAAREYIILGLINGCMICIIIYSLYHYRSKRDPVYAYYIIYITATQALYTSSGGLMSQYLVPDAPLIADAMFGASFCIVTASGLLFGARLMDLGRHAPWVDRLSHWAAGFFLLASLSVLADRYYVVSNAVQATALGLLVMINVLAVVRMIRGDRVAMFFLAAFLVYLILVAMMMLRALGLYVTPASTNIIAQAVAVPHMLLLSLGLLHRSAGIEATRLETSRRAERELEARVAQRTMELAQTNASLAAEIAVRRAAENRLRESERQVRAILDAAPFPMIVAGYPDGHLHFVNQPAIEFLGVDGDRALTMRTEEFYADPSERRHFLMKLAETGGILGAELRIRRVPDEIRWVLLSAVRFTYRDQDAILICLNDISTRKRLEETLREASLRSEAALEAGRQSMREQRNFLSMVSHEFRVPLAIIEAASQLLGIYTRDDDEAQDEVAKIGRAVRRMSELIDVCLADDRLDSASWSLSLSEVDLTRLLSELCEDKRPFAGDRRLTLVADAPQVVDADSTMLRVGFSNLIDNALKFSPSTSPIEIHVRGDGDGVMVGITDHGPGIALDEQPRIFEKFYRSTRSDRVRGAGLGLYIVRRIVDLHGGSIAVNSLPGEGATFVVWLPVRSNAQGNP